MRPQADSGLERLHSSLCGERDSAILESTGSANYARTPVQDWENITLWLPTEGRLDSQQGTV